MYSQLAVYIMNLNLDSDGMGTSGTPEVPVLDPPPGFEDSPLEVEDHFYDDPYCGLEEFEDLTPIALVGDCPDSVTVSGELVGT